MIPHAEHVGHAAGIERAPDLRRAGNALEETGLVDRLVLRRAGQDRIVAVQDGFDVDVGPVLGVVGVVAHPFAERAFRLGLAGHGLALDGDLAIGRDRESSIGAAHHVDRPPRKPPAISSSLTSGSGLDDSMNNSGSWPHRITTFIGSPRAKYLSRWIRPCLPSVIWQPTVLPS